MKCLTVRANLILLAVLAVAGGAVAADKGPVQAAWALVVKGPVDVYPKSSHGKKVLAHLSARTLLPTFKTKTAGGRGWTQVRVRTPGTLEVKMGWTESSRLELLPLDRFPSDSDLETLLGGEYLQDVNARYTQIARFLVRLGGGKTALVCYVGSIFIPHTRLQVFEQQDGKWAAGPFLEFLSSQMQTGVTQIEVRDLLGDGNECLITHEPFAQTFGTSGVNLVIRRVEAGQFQTLWQAPLELRNLTSFARTTKVLDPPVENIGAPGTVTTGSVDYQTDGSISEPVWKGKVEFHIPGREEPINTLSVEKVCKWNGSEFAPLK
jgi:hypothetical protein